MIFACQPHSPDSSASFICFSKSANHFFSSACQTVSVCKIHFIVHAQTDRCEEAHCALQCVHNPSTNDTDINFPHKFQLSFRINASSHRRHVVIILLFFAVVESEVIEVDFEPGRFPLGDHQPRPNLPNPDLLYLELDVPPSDFVSAPLKSLGENTSTCKLTIQPRMIEIISSTARLTLDEWEGTAANHLHWHRKTKDTVLASIRQ